MAKALVNAAALSKLGILTNDLKGQMSAGLSGQGDAGLKECDKLPLVPIEFVEWGIKAEDARSDWAVCEGLEAKSRVLIAIAHAAIAAEKAGIQGLAKESLDSSKAHLVLEVSCAFAAVYAGLVGYFQADPALVRVSDAEDVSYLYMNKPAIRLDPSHVCEHDTVGAFYPIIENIPVFCTPDSPAQDTRDMLKAEMQRAMEMAVEAVTNPRGTWLSTYTSQSETSKALTVLIATKINWFCTNHHVGQGKASRYISKVVSTTYSWASTGDGGIIDKARESVWKVGHWISTHLSLRLLGMRTGVRVCVHPVAAGLDEVVLSEDFKVRCDSPPAGMAKLALLYSAMLLYKNSSLWMVAPHMSEVVECVSSYKEFLASVDRSKVRKTVDPRCRNHEGHKFLTKQTDKTPIMSLPCPLGMVGSFLYWKQSKSTLAQSPLITKDYGSARSIQNYPTLHGFDHDFDQICRH